MEPIDAPLEITRSTRGKYVWPNRYWNFLSVFGGYLSHAPLDDVEVEAFEDHAVLLLNFHQVKGLEFDHVYVAGTGRPPDSSPALRTMLFSGQQPVYGIDTSGNLTCSDSHVARLALSDREREVYVALTRARSNLTVLHDPEQQWPFLKLNPVLSDLFKGRQSTLHQIDARVKVSEFMP